MAVNWTDSEVFLLISCWGEEGIQEQLEGCKRNKHIYERLSTLLAEHGVHKSGEQCRTKVKKLRQEYKKIKDNNKGTGNGRIEWKYFNKLDNIFTSRPATHPPVLLETLKPVESSDSDVTDVEEQGDNALEQSDSKEDGNQSESGTASLSSTPVSPHSDGSIKGAGTEDIVKKDKAGIKGKKRKRSKGEVFEDVMTKAMKVMTDGLRDSDKMFIQLEEKRMEFEERQRREERELKLRMVQMLQGRMGGASYYPSYGEPYGHGSSPPPAPYYDPADDNY